MSGPASSIASLPWAVSLFGAQQFMTTLADPRRAEGALYSATRAVIEQFGSQPLAFGAFQIGDEIQRGAVDLLYDTLALRVFQPEWIARATRDAAGRAFEATRALTPGENLRSTADLLRNTFGVINLVNRAAGMLDLPPGPIDLGRAVSHAYTFGDYSTLWLIEGLGEAYAGQQWTGSLAPKGLLTAGQGAALPEKSLLMMHAGMGIAFARRAVRTLTPVSPKPDIADALRRFIDLVRANSRPGYEGPAFESLGLVTRTWYSPMVPLIDEQLWSLDVDVLEYFWHGVGRSVYFTPFYLVPGNNPFRGVRAEAPHELGQLNGVAGAAWAFTLVNIRQPEVLVNLVRTQHQALEVDDAFTNGVVSTALMATDMLPGDPYVKSLCAFRPACSCSGLRTLWERLVRGPCETALRDSFPTLQSRGRLGEVFRYRDWKKLRARPEVPR